MDLPKDETSFCYAQFVTDFLKSKNHPNPEGWLSGFNKKIYDHSIKQQMKQIMVNSHFRILLENYATNNDQNTMAVRRFICDGVADFIWKSNFETRVLPFVLKHNLC